MNKLADDRRIRILHALLERDAQRSIVRRERVSIKTVARLLPDAGDMAIEHINSLGGFRFRCVQADELHSYVGARQRNVPRLKSKNPDAGTVWTFLAIDCDSRFVFDYRLGAQNVYDATSFMKSVAAKLKRRTDGRFVRRPTIVTDGLHSYKEACQIAFGTDADVGVLKKKYSGTDPDGNLLPGSRYVESVRIPLIGSPRREDITTAYIERFNFTLIFIQGSGNRRDCDVLAAVELRRYTRFKSWSDSNYNAGICFWTSDGTKIINFPKQHSANCTSKHQRTGNWFKPCVRILKNMRNCIVEKGYLKEGVAPSYFLEGLIYNVPDSKFGGSYGDSIVNSINWILTTDRSKFVCVRCTISAIPPRLSLGEPRIFRRSSMQL